MHVSPCTCIPGIHYIFVSCIAVCAYGSCEVYGMHIEVCMPIAVWRLHKHT